MEVVVGVPIGGTEEEEFHIHGMGVVDIMGVGRVHTMEAVVGALEEVIVPKINQETCHAEYPQSVSARADTQYESPHSQPAGY